MINWLSITYMYHILFNNEALYHNMINWLSITGVIYLVPQANECWDIIIYLYIKHHLCIYIYIWQTPIEYVLYMHHRNVPNYLSIKCFNFRCWSQINTQPEGLTILVWTKWLLCLMFCYIKAKPEGFVFRQAQQPHYNNFYGTWNITQTIISMIKTHARKQTTKHTCGE